MRPIAYLKELIGSGDPRVHAFVTLMTSCTLCLVTLWLAWLTRTRSVATELGIAVGALMTLTGYIYKKGKEQGGSQ